MAEVKTTTSEKIEENAQKEAGDVKVVKEKKGGAETKNEEKKSADTEAAEKPAIKAKKKKIRRQIQHARAYIKCTYNNTIINITDINGASLAWSSAGSLGFKGAKKATPYAATQVVGDLSEKIAKYGVGELELFVKGVGSGREGSIRALANKGYKIVSINDRTPIPHNGCRPKKPRRV